MIWAGPGRTPQPHEDLPGIVVEFVSPGRASWIRDSISKRSEYLAIGVKEYRIIDRFHRTTTVYREPSAQPAEIVENEADTYESTLLPGSLGTRARGRGRLAIQ